VAKSFTVELLWSCTLRVAPWRNYVKHIDADKLTRSRGNGVRRQHASHNWALHIMAVMDSYA